MFWSASNFAMSDPPGLYIDTVASTAPTVALAEAMSHLTPLAKVRLPKKNGKPTALPLREFLLDFCACRQSLTLRQGPLTWQIVGINTSVTMNAHLSTWEHCLQRHRYVMALPGFAKHGSKLDKQLRLGRKKGDCWQPYLAAMSEQALDAALAPGAPDRLNDLVFSLRAAEVPFLDSRFVYGNAQAGSANLGYALSSGPVAGASKMEIHDRWQKQTRIGRFYSQHGMILFSEGGQRSVLAKKQIQDIDNTVCLGDGALRLLGLLRAEADCPPEVHWTPANVEWITKAVLKERELFARMATERFQGHPELLPICLRRKRVSGQWQYECIPEVFGDFLCESAQLLIALLTQGSAKHRKTPWSQSKPWPEHMVPSQSCSAKRRRVS